ncbi:uncharacterized protein LOC142661742 isoform X2 [Rhinoderma darwinii]|uniref:uncharacterized protein LOC142661742 isoform X2 n=1 Tax=Rhinoderma darwinii TaxID=43563 RepID=UPI003F668AA3
MLLSPSGVLCQSPGYQPNCDCHLDCPAGTYFSTGSCWECPSGFYCPGGSAAPRQCPTGTVNSIPGKSDLLDCQVCPLGFIGVDSGQACRPCPSGYSCDPASDLLTHCSPGYYSQEGQLHCSQCPDGFVCPDGRDWKLCPPGQEPAENHTRCVECAPGFFSTWSSSRCLPCLPGSYCPFAGKIHTVISPAGFLKDGSGQISSCICSNCPPTHDVEDPHQSNDMQVTCHPGYYVTTGGQLECKLCPPGYFCADGSTKTPCPAGTFSEKEGLLQQSECTLCPAGYFCLEGKSLPPAEGSLCPAGFYCPIGTRNSHAYPCPAGTYNDQVGQGHRGSCKVCSEGLFCQEGSPVTGYPCTRGKFCPAGVSREQDCPPGTFTHHSGAYRIEECSLCPAGFYCLSNTSYPIPCPPGTQNPLEGQDQSGDCTPCSAGSACTRSGLTQPDTDCSPGYVCPVGSRSATSSENACPAGTYSDSQSLFDKSQCEICPDRFFCATGSGGRQRPPVPCPRGHYCPPGTKHGSQYKCPPGTWSDRPSLASDRECYPCPAGWFCLAGAESPSGKCSAGYFCTEGSQSGTQFPCPAGTFNLKLGSVRVGECSACPEGAYCPAGTSKPALCPMGTYRAEQGAQNVGECDLCPAGTSCPNIGMNSAVPCGAGNFSDRGSSTCLACPAGHYCNEDRTSRERMMQLLCPAGIVCPKGMAVLPGEDVNMCPRGYYCPEGSREAKPCPNGTFGFHPGLEGVEDCLLCPEGNYCYQEGQRGIPSPNGLCPQGYYCPPGTGSPLSYPCQPGSYWNMSKQGVEISVCLPCPAGFFCDMPSLLAPKRCPAGFYCHQGSSYPQPCPEGTYSPRDEISTEAECHPCEAGKFCSGVGLTAISGDCQEGFYCPERSTSATPSGGMCPAGSYCPGNSGWPVLCPPGTYSNQIGLTEVSQCLICPPGLFCDGQSGSSPNGNCTPGYYCTAGSSSPVQHDVTQGYYSLEGAFRPESCPPGTFQPLPAQSSCRQCPSGNFCNASSLSDVSSCLQGHFCPAGSISPTPCPVGTFSNTSGNIAVDYCELCSLGMYCSRPGLAQPEGYCEMGHYCTRGSYTSVPIELAFGDLCPVGHFCSKGIRLACPRGTWNGRKEAVNSSWCLPCLPGSFCDMPGLAEPTGPCHSGYFCRLGSSSPRPEGGIVGDICPSKHFCPEGSSDPIPCPEGTYSNSTGQSVCYICDSGHTCLSGDSIVCPAGYFCPEATGPVPCPPGTFSPIPRLTRAQGCLPCPPGMYCSEWGSGAVSGPCQPGFFCTGGSLVPNPTGNLNESFGGPCPVGHFCPAGSGAPIPCPSGSFSDRSNLSMESHCAPCPPGYYCSSVGLHSPTGLCLAGYYCSLGVSSSAPTGELFTGEGGCCPQGHYCPAGSPHPHACPAGTYNNRTHQQDCSPCPAGYFCAENTSDYSAYPCPAGFYCPGGTQHSRQFPCPRGYYNPDPKSHSIDSCLPCSPGHFCGVEGLSAVSGKCDPGWFCVSAAWTPQPFDLDNYTSANCLCPATSTGGKCLPGFYCPEGITEPISCPPGFYCENAGLAAPSGECAAGFFCTGGAKTPRPTDAVQGNICPPGTFCPNGSHHPQLCPAGTFSSDSGLGSISECKPCPPGLYCHGSGKISPTGQCSEGCYCPEGQTLPDGLPCAPGHRCPAGSLKPIPCESGFYQNEEKQATCRICEPGFFCQQREQPVSDYTQFICPQGYFCPAGTQVGNQNSCPEGTYGPRRGLFSIMDCVLCPPGKFCKGLGQAAPTGNCSSGYWCKEGAADKHPLDGLSGDICSSGHYCPEGTHTPQPCPAGTWSDVEGLGNRLECRPCPAGYFCNYSGLASPSGQCAPGYYCSGGAKARTPTDSLLGGLCPPGHYCLSGSSGPILCPAGTYMIQSGAAECDVCPAGKYCIPGMSHQPCPRGFYCLQGTSLDWKPCQPGTYSSELGLDSAAGCRVCDGGKHCMFYNSTSVTGDCAEGYYCFAGSQRPDPEEEIPGSAGPCPPGHFCPRGSVVSTPCPLGTFSSRIKLHSEADCTPCVPGHYCDSPGLVLPAGPCSEGFYCISSSISPRLSSVSPMGGPCPKGHFCSVGSSAPQPCPPGTFNAIERQGICQPCTEGFFCLNSTTSLEGKACPPGFYCPAGTFSPGQFPCPRGTYNPQRGSQLLRDCFPCDPGHYCDTPGQTRVSGLCSEGYFCTHSVKTSTPNQGILGDVCPTGYYCPAGTVIPHPCPAGLYSNTSANVGPEACVRCEPGYFCDRPGLAAPNGPCDAGYYCTGASVSPHPSKVTSSGGPCPTGHFCPQGSQTPQVCPAGTFSQYLGQASCSECPEGLYCPVQSTNTTICPEGYYCPKRTTFAEQYPCPQGTFSRTQGATDIGTCLPCPSGMFCSKLGLGRPEGFCAPGWFCPVGSISDKPVYPLEIPGTTISSNLSRYSRMCPPGTFCPQGSSYAIPCTPGKYCASPELDSESGSCDPGFYCSSRSTLPNPRDGEIGDICPPGHFCIAGSPSPSPCPPGTFLPVSGAQSFQDCLLCTCGFYCSRWGGVVPDAECIAGWYCPPGTINPQSPEHVCPIGHRCPPGSSEPKACPMGQFQDKIGQSQCEVCPAGKYCGLLKTEETQESVLGNYYVPMECPAGYFCVEGTEYGQMHPCPTGSFSNQTGLMSREECSPCPGGWFCARPGLSSPSEKCLPGYYCTLNAQLPNPADGASGGLCPAGYYCPLGSRGPLPCPPGTFQPYLKMSSLESCLPCPAGKFCRGEASSHISGNCSAGFYCVLGAAFESPIDGITGSYCPQGHSCPSGSSAPISCVNGKFQDLERESSCKICPLGFYCDTSELGGVVIPQPCPAGYFCPRGTQSGVEHRCPGGTYSSASQLAAQAECRSCPSGYYCAGEGLTEPSGRCLPGFWCIGRAETSNPTDGVTGNVCPAGKFCEDGDISGDCKAGHFCDIRSSRCDQMICPPGFYCPEGTPVPIPCDSGTYASLSGNKAPKDCRPCPPGHFCNGTGKAVWQGLCSPGFYCPLGQISPRPSAHCCPSGFYCPAGSAAPAPCESGSYQSLEGREACNACPTGFYCGSGNDSSGISMPALCPTGHYCPPGASFITVYPCPGGTYGPKTGASSISDCESCPAGMYCSSEGLNEPTGYCYAGYYCSQGAINPMPITPRAPFDLHYPQNDVCPAGHFCPNGTRSPVPCPPGSFSMAAGLSTMEECQPCPAGHYCPQAGLSDPSLALPCSPGYVCKEGSFVSCPSDDLHGYRCPSGFYCPSGTSIEIPCEPGSFSPMSGSSMCLPCPAGSSCLHVSTVEPLNCPRGHYCPALTSVPIPCPAGTFNPIEGALTLASCKRCPAGRYCRGEANSEPDGLCSPGYYCEGEAADNIPQRTSRFPLNGPCPLGHYCPEGTLFPKPCPAGTLKNTTGGSSMDNCVPCYTGYFCASVGLSSPTGLCSAGFFCPGNFTSTSPTAFLCPKGHFCTAGSSHPLPCPTGLYQPNTGSHSCIPCQPGFYCQEAVAGHPHPCPPHSYCTAGTLFPLPCPNGTYTSLETSGLREKGECLPCPPGHYCRGGKLQGPCAAGHFCLSGSTEYTPYVQNFSRSSPTECNWGQMCAGICPPGFYCQEGTVLPNPCPANTVRSSPGGRHREDCASCPQGYWCKEGNPAPVLCPAGYYCSGRNRTNSNHTAEPQECPVHTYRALAGAERAGDCLPCPPGYFCKLSGSIGESFCRAGSYCTSRTGIPQLCPGGYFCPEGSTTYNTSAHLCTFPYYCPPGSARRMSCPGGSTALHGITLRDSEETSCRKCGPGTYRSASVTDVICQPCPAGYSCPQGVENYKSYPCLAGHYCPSSATAPVPCPTGTYGNSTQGRELGDCRPCPTGTYNHLSAQVSCFLCGTSSYSQPGSKSCVCRGRNRSFQESDGSCICQAGFVFYDNREKQRSDSNSDLDCQPQVEERCSSAEVRLSSTRKCVIPERHDCTPTCGLQGGELSAALGMCHCLQYVSAEELCDRFCLMKVPRISMSFGSNLQFQLQIEESEKRRSRKLEVMNVLGPDHHVWSSEQVHLVLFSPSGVFGVLLSSAQVIEAFLTGDSWSVPTPRKARAGDQILTSTDPVSFPRIPSPILCLKEGDVVLFQLSISPNERMSSHYPLYQKDHLFNTNPHWDFGAFRRLDHLIRETHINVSRFAHVFTDPGTYVFVDNGVRDRSLFVTVKENNVYCDPAASRIQPSSPYQLVKQGIVTQHRLNLAPNWAAILGILLLLFIVMVTLLVLTLVLRPSLYVPSPLKNWKPRWRSLGEPYVPPEYVLTRDSLQFYEAVGCHGSGEILDTGKKEISYGLDQRKSIRVLEDFNVRTLFDKLEDQNLHLTSQLGRHRNETLSFYKAFIHRIQVLKEMLQTLDLATNKCVEWRKIPLEGEEESTRAIMTSQQSQSSSLSMNHGSNTDPSPGVFMQEATALMKVVKLTLMKVASELATKKSMSAMEQHNRVKGLNEPRAARPPEQDQTLANKNAYEGLMNGNIPMLSSVGLQLQPLLFMTALYREENLKKLITASPLTKTLEEIKEALKKQAQEKEVNGNFAPVTIGNLVPMDMSQLSPRQLIVFRFGSALLHLVCRSCSQYPLLLLIAQTIPRIQRSGQLKEMLQLGDSYFDTENKILFVPSTCLDHVGELALIIVHAVAQISTEMPQTPLNVEYLQCMNGAFRAISCAFFHSWGAERSGRLTDMSRANSDMKTALGDLLMIHKLPDHYHVQRSCKFYSKFKNQRIMENVFVKNSGRLRENPKELRSDQTALQEEAIDALNEEFLQLVKQAMENKREYRELGAETESAGDPSVFNRLAEKRDLAVLLEIQRRCTSQKISAAESELLYLHPPDTTSSALQTPSYNQCFDAADKCLP